jgi:hypothetical protein
VGPRHRALFSIFGRQHEIALDAAGDRLRRLIATKPQAGAFAVRGRNAVRRLVPPSPRYGAAGTARRLQQLAVYPLHLFSYLR